MFDHLYVPVSYADSLSSLGILSICLDFFSSDSLEVVRSDRRMVCALAKTSSVLASLLGDLCEQHRERFWRSIVDDRTASTHSMPEMQAAISRAMDTLYRPYPPAASTCYSAPPSRSPLEFPFSGRRRFAHYPADSSNDSDDA